MKNMLKFNQLWFLTRAMFMELIREPAVLFWGILFPILMSLGLGIAFTQKADTERKVGFISDSVQQEQMSTYLGAYGKITESNKDTAFPYSLTIPDNQLGNSIFHFKKLEMARATLMLKRGEINLILIDKNGKPEYHFDPLNPDAQLSYLKLSRVYGHTGQNPAINEAVVKPLTLTGTRYIDFLVPGLIALGIMMACMWGLSYSIIDKRSKKLLRRMLATPMRRSHFLISLMSVRAIMNLIEALLLYIFVYFAFDIRISGSLTAAALLFVAGNTAFAGISVLLSSRTSNTEIGNGMINAVVLPMMVMSGIFFSYHNFPDWSIPFIQNLPLTMLADGFRSVFTEGAGIQEVLMPVTILSTIGVVLFGVGLKIFKWH
jgi:ABC-2 type transport system permease protein